MSAHRPGDHSREIDVRALREWISAGRPGAGIREWRSEAARERSHDRWPFWPVVWIAVTTFVIAALLGGVAYVLDQRPTGYIRPMSSSAGWWR